MRRAAWGNDFNIVWLASNYNAVMGGRIMKIMQSALWVTDG